MKNLINLWYLIKVAQTAAENNANQPYVGNVYQNYRNIPAAPQNYRTNLALAANNALRTRPARSNTKQVKQPQTAMPVGQLQVQQQTQTITPQQPQPNATNQGYLSRNA